MPTTASIAHELEERSRILNRAGTKLRTLGAMLEAAHHDEPEVDEQLYPVRVGLGMMINEIADTVLRVARDVAELPYDHNTLEDKK